MTDTEPSSRAGEPALTILSGGPNSTEIIIAFEGRPDPIPLSLCFSEDNIRPLFDGGAWAGSMVWDARCAHFLRSFSERIVLSLIMAKFLYENHSSGSQYVNYLSTPIP